MLTKRRLEHERRKKTKEEHSEKSMETLTGKTTKTKNRSAEAPITKRKTNAQRSLPATRKHVKARAHLPKPQIPPIFLFVSVTQALPPVPSTLLSVSLLFIRGFPVPPPPGTAFRTTVVLRDQKLPVIVSLRAARCSCLFIDGGVWRAGTFSTSPSFRRPPPSSSCSCWARSPPSPDSALPSSDAGEAGLPHHSVTAATVFAGFFRSRGRESPVEVSPAFTDAAGRR